MSTDVIRHFDRIADRWQAKYFPSGSMEHRLAIFTGAVGKVLPRGAQVLDYGCGTGDISHALGDAGFRVLGVDRAFRMIEVAEARRQDANVTFEHLGRRDEEVAVQFGDRRFDGVVLSSVIEYVSKPEVLLRQLGLVSCDGSWLFASVPNIWHPRRWVECGVAAYDRLRGVSPETLSPYREYLQVSITRPSLAEWKRIFAQAGWEVVEVRGRTSPLLMLIARRRSEP